MITSEAELFLAELGVNPQEEIEGDYGLKIKLKDLLNKFKNKKK